MITMLLAGVTTWMVAEFPEMINAGGIQGIQRKMTNSHFGHSELFVTHQCQDF